MLRLFTSAPTCLRPRNLALAQQCGLRQSVEERLGLPEKPKRPSAPFIKYMAHVRPEIVAQNRGIQPVEIIKKGAEMWRNCSEETKKKFNEIYLKDKEQYNVLLSKYNASLTPQQKQEIDDALEEVKEEKEKKEIRLSNAKRNKELGKPTKPLSSFFLFIKSEMHNRGNTELSQYNVLLGKKWKSLSAEQREKYVKEAARAKVEYDQELAAWEKKMIKLGNLDVVRSKVLDETLPKKGTRKE